MTIGALFVVGAQRSGSTYLATLLDEHPEIAMARPFRPEPKVFLDEAIVKLGRANYESTYFPTRTPRTRYLGEKSTTYLERSDAADRIHSLYRDARILIMLRDPVARALSNYRFSKEHGFEAFEFAVAIEREDERKSSRYHASTNPFAYTERGYYERYIRDYLTVFDASCVRVEIFEDFVGSTQAVGDLYAWLGVDSDFVPPSLSTVVNASAPGGGTGSDGRAASAMSDRATLRMLADGYEQTLATLEQLIERPLDAWRAAWAQL